MPASASGATSIGVMLALSFISERSLVMKYSAKPPSMPRPGNMPLSQYMSSPWRQFGRCRTERNGWQITASPRFTDFTPAADLLDPAGVLVAHDVGQQRAAGIHSRLPHALDDVEIGAAEVRLRPPRTITSSGRLSLATEPPRS